MGVYTGSSALPWRISRDGISDPDVAAVVASGEVVVELGNGDGTFTTGGTFDYGSFLLRIVVADVTGDGRPDLQTLNANGGNTFSVLRNSGDAHFTSPPAYPTGMGTGGVHLVDIDGDGRLDAVTSGTMTNGTSLSPAVTVLYAAGAGGFGTPHSFPVGGGPDFGVSVITVADIHRDGIPDLAVVSGNEIPDLVSSDSVGTSTGEFLGLITFHAGYGDGTFQDPGVTKLVTACFTPVLSGDFNGDGKLDLAVGSLGRITVQFGDGAGHFSTVVTPLAGTPTAMALGDMNNDGILDVVATFGGHPYLSPQYN